MRERQNQDRDHYSDNTSSSRFDELPDDFDPSGRLGSFVDADPQTTNLYVGNLSPTADENFLLRTFGRFGPIASVRIMWPRTEEERRRRTHCGFVAFMNRADGQAAKDEMQGIIVYEYELKIGWGEAVALPSQALPAPPPGHMAIRSKEGCNLIFSGPPITVPNQNSELVLTPNVPDVTVVCPEDEHLKHVIDTMALNVLHGGCAFEQAIMERGRGNPLFNFLFELGSKEHTYYVWRLYSFAMGDTLQRWRTEPYIMMNGSGRWMPPLQQGMKNSEEMERKVAIQRKRLEADGLSGNQRVLPEKRERREDSRERESSRKRHRSERQHRSQSPPQKSSTREWVRDHDLDRERHRDRYRQLHDVDKDRELRVKSFKS